MISCVLLITLQEIVPKATWKAHKFSIGGMPLRPLQRLMQRIPQTLCLGNFSILASLLAVSDLSFVEASGYGYGNYIWVSMQCAYWEGVHS